MAGRWDLGLPKTSAGNLKEQLFRTTLNNVRSQGHPYVELREDGKRLIFFCTLCLARCYGDTVLMDHLKGNLHTERLSAAKLTLLKPNPWPFSDGVHFFNTSIGNEKDSVTINGSQGELESHNGDNSLAIVRYGENLRPGCNGHAELEGNKANMDFYGTGGDFDLLIPGVLIKDEVSDLKVRFVGHGQIAARFCGKGDISSEISRIWCEWLGKEDLGNDDKVRVLDHDFAVVTFPYDYNLGRQGLLDDLKLLLTSSPHSEMESGKGSNKRRKKSFSDPGDISDSLSNQCDSSGEESAASNGTSSKLLLDHYDDQLLNTSFISSKAIRRELRRQQRIAAERMCDICQQKMLPEKDVAALVNVKTGRLACSSRNMNGAFHVFHTSCLVHWILLCELEMTRNESVSPKIKGRSRRKNGARCNKSGKNGKTKALKCKIVSVFCPDCQGSGLNIDGHDREMPTVPLSEMFKYKIKISDGHRSWMRNPEVLENCSTGFYFPLQSEETVQVSISLYKC
uniref:Uncharacterized protein MANES_13G147300 n=1 Tax=Rhizophora mucronata TaxID=61149 RepID=A0A2P2J9F5_RHIMU